MYPPHTLERTELRVLPVSAHGRHYQLHVYLPASYADHPAARYPVLYVTDGYYDFPTVLASYLNEVYDRVAPDCIVVGLGYAGQNLDYETMRRWELSPVQLAKGDLNSGHGAEFLDSIKHQIIPFVEKEYRADPTHRYLGGSSLGGLFTLYTMLTDPDLFQGYIAASPAVGADENWLFEYETSFVASKRPIHARLFMAGAEHEGFYPDIRRFDQQLRAAPLPELAYQFRTIDGERHATEKAGSYTRGMLFVFAPIAPETDEPR